MGKDKTEKTHPLTCLSSAVLFSFTWERMSEQAKTFSLKKYPGIR